MEYTMGASHSVEATDTTIEDVIEDPPDPDEDEVEEVEDEQDQSMSWFWPII
jgi:hypothetical protein